MSDIVLPSEFLVCDDLEVRAQADVITGKLNKIFHDNMLSCVAEVRDTENGHLHMIWIKSL